MSTQDTEYQFEVVERLHLPYPLLSDEKLEFTKALKLPTFEAEGVGRLLKRMVLVIKNGTITEVFYPVFPPESSATEVLNWLKQQ
jgi:peroxiredoxin